MVPPSSYASYSRRGLSKVDPYQNESAPEHQRWGYLFAQKYYSQDWSEDWNNKLDEPS
jgi:hypothetical protein